MNIDRKSPAATGTDRMPPATDAGLARWLAQRTGAALLELRRSMGHEDPNLLRKTGDLHAHDLLVEALARWRPDDAVLSEEDAHADAARLAADRVWIVDPLDGTREFAEPERTDWAVHVALWRRGHGVVAGAVSLPARHQIFTTESPPGYPLLRSPDAAAPLRLAASRTRPPAFLAELADRLGGVDLVPMGSAGVKICAVVTGEVDAYLHAGGQFEWDSAAPEVVAAATGLFTSRLDGSALEYNQTDPWLPDIMVCRKDLAPRLLAALAHCVIGR